MLVAKHGDDPSTEPTSLKNGIHGSIKELTCPKHQATPWPKNLPQPFRCSKSPTESHRVKVDGPMDLQPQRWAQIQLNQRTGSLMSKLTNNCGCSKPDHRIRDSCCLNLPRHISQLALKPSF